MHCNVGAQIIWTFEAGKAATRKYHRTPDYESPWRLSDLTTQRSKEERPNSFFDLKNPRDGKSYPANPNRVWGVTKDSVGSYLEKGKIVFPGDYDFLNITKPSYRVFEEEDKAKNLKKYGSEETKVAISTLLPNDIGRSEDGTKDIDDLFGKKVFSYPKPVSLIKFLLRTFNDEECIVLDFFSGSGSTAHALLEFNEESSCNRKFICVQMPELCDEKSDAYQSGFKTISEISKERIRRVINKVKSTRKNESDSDLGFRSFRLIDSNYKRWKNIESNSLLDLEKNLQLFNNNPLQDNWNVNKLLTEIILLEGFTLSATINQLLEISSNKIFSVTEEFSEHTLLICLDHKVNPQTIQFLELTGNDIFICLDSAISNVDKLRLSDKGLIKTI